MCKNSQKAFAILAWLAGSPQGGAEQPLVSGNSAFNLPAIVVNALMEPLLHLSAVFGRRPPAATSPDVEGNDCGADAELFSTQAMVVFPVVGGVSKEPIKAQVLCRLDDSLRELSRVVRWSTGHCRPGNQCDRRWSSLASDDGGNACSPCAQRNRCWRGGFPIRWHRLPLRDARLSGRGRGLARKSLQAGAQKPLF